MPIRFAIVGGLAIAIAALLAFNIIQGLRATVSDLEAANKRANDTIVSRDRTIDSLRVRENELKQIEADYDTILEEFKHEEDGPVSPVLRHAIERDLVRAP